jgi:hypothetical protein
MVVHGHLDGGKFRGSFNAGLDVWGDSNVDILSPKGKREKADGNEESGLEQTDVGVWTHRGTG